VVVALIGRDIFVKIQPLYDATAAGGGVLPNVDAELLQYVQEMFESNGKVVKRLNEILSENGVSVTDVRDGCIQVTFTCKTLKSLKYFQQLCKSGELETLLNEAFCPKFADKGLLSLALEIFYEQFDNCEKSFLQLAPMTSQHRKALESAEKSLANRVTVNDDLLDTLKLRGRRRQAIERAATREQQVKTLLDIVSRRPESAFMELLCAFRNTQEPQTIEVLLTEVDDCAKKFPVPTGSEFSSSVYPQTLKRTSFVGEIEMELEKKRQRLEHKDAAFTVLITDHFALLLRCLDPSNELLGQLLSVKFVSDHVSVINKNVNVDNKTNALLTVLLQIPDELQESVMDKFVAALRSSGQDHVANIFYRQSQKIPMSDEHCQILAKQRHQLCQFLDPENGLLDKLVSAGVITSVDNRRIRSKVRLDVMAGELIDTILKKSDDAFEALVQALNETGQSHVTSFITGKSSSIPLSQALKETEQAHVTSILTDKSSSLPLTPALAHRLISRRYYMVNTMEPKNSALVSALITKGVFSQYDALRVSSKYHEGTIVVNETIVDLLMRKSLSAFDLFVEALTDTGQHLVAAELKSDDMKSIPTSAKPHKG